MDKEASSTTCFHCLTEWKQAKGLTTSNPTTMRSAIAGCRCLTMRRESPQLEHRVGGVQIVRPDPNNRHDCRFWIQICQGLQDVSDALTSCFGLPAYWKGALATSTFSGICFAIVRTTSLRIMSPTTIPITPPSGLWSAVSRPSLMASRMVCGT